MGAYLASFSDVVLGAGGKAVAGATVTCYPVSAFAPGTLPFSKNAARPAIGVTL